MITAEEARKLTLEAKRNSLEQELEKIFEEIEAAIMDKKYSCSIKGSVSHDVREYLQSLGYQVSYGSHYNESYTTISWEERKEYHDYCSSRPNRIG